MTNEPNTQRVGDDAWKAAKQRIADNNKAAYARGRQERAARDAELADRRRAAERREAADLPTPPRDRSAPRREQPS